MTPTDDGYDTYRASFDLVDIQHDVQCQCAEADVMQEKSNLAETTGS